MKQPKKSRSRSLPNSRRRKVTNACDNCKKRKYKCTGEQPCYLCQKRGNECNYLILDKRSLKGERLARQRHLASSDQTKKEPHNNSFSDSPQNNASSSFTNPVNTTKMPSLASVLPAIKFPQQPPYLHHQSPPQPLPAPSISYYPQSNHFNDAYLHSFPSAAPSTPANLFMSPQSSVSLHPATNTNGNYYPYYNMTGAPVMYPIPNGYSATNATIPAAIPPPARSYSTSSAVSSVPLPPSTWASRLGLPSIAKTQETTNQVAQPKLEEPGVLYSSFDHTVKPEESKVQAQPNNIGTGPA